jgi:uncharacterized protein (DUF2141 family)
MNAGWVLLVALFVTMEAQAATVTVTITDVRDSRGVVRVAVCPRADFLHPRCPYVGLTRSETGSVVVTIKNVPPGVYAAQAFQDAKDTGILERNWLGLPKEGMGFSNNAPMRFGPPNFSDAAFALGAGDAAISFRLRYFVRP